MTTTAKCGACGKELKINRNSGYPNVEREHDCQVPLYEAETGKIVGYLPNNVKK